MRRGQLRMVPIMFGMLSSGTGLAFEVPNRLSARETTKSLGELHAGRGLGREIDRHAVPGTEKRIADTMPLRVGVQGRSTEWVMATRLPSNPRMSLISVAQPSIACPRLPPLALRLARLAEAHALVYQAIEGMIGAGADRLRG